MIRFMAPISGTCLMSLWQNYRIGQKGSHIVTLEISYSSDRVLYGYLKVKSMDIYRVAQKMFIIVEKLCPYWQPAFI